MKYVILFFLIFSTSALFGQQDSSQQRPTLGPAPASSRPSLRGTAPSLMGPMNAKIFDPAKLRMVHKVYIGLMDNSLNLKLLKDFPARGQFQVVSNRHEADAILQGTCFNSPHLKDVHSEVFLTGRNGKPIWQDIIHQSYNPPTLGRAVTETAARIVMDLRVSVEAAGRR